MPKGKPHPRLSSSDDDEDDTTPLCELKGVQAAKTAKAAAAALKEKAAADKKAAARLRKLLQLVHMARLSPPDRRSTLILLTPDGDGVWYGPGAPLGLRLTDGYRGRVDIIGICAPRTMVHNYASS